MLLRPSGRMLTYMVDSSRVEVSGGKDWSRAEVTKDAGGALITVVATLGWVTEATGKSTGGTMGGDGLRTPPSATVTGEANAANVMRKCSISDSRITLT